MRLQKFLSAAGVSSRRGAEEIIKQGLVSVNGEVVTEMGIQIDPDVDSVTAHNKVVRVPSQKLYLMFNKPTGYLTTVTDPHGRKTVFDLLPRRYQSLFPVGRLDKDSEGLLLLTNDGEMAQELTHPSFEHVKEYRVRVVKKITREFLAKLKQGIELEEGLAKADGVEKLGPKEFKLTLHQGWKRQIRRMVESLDYKVEALQRIRLANYHIDSLDAKPYKEIDKNEII